jgi:hypothetical protein
MTQKVIVVSYFSKKNYILNIYQVILILYIFYIILELKLEMVQMVFIKTKYLVPKFDNAKRQKH